MTLVIPLKFEGFTLDLDRLCLLGPSGHIDLRPKSFDVLRYLVEHAGRVVTKDEVIASVWPHATVTDESLTVCISEVRRALGDADQRILRTVPRRGYLFDVAVSIDDEPSSQAIAAGRNDQPVVAVLPFQNMSGDPRQDHLADAMTEEIITALSRFSDLFVIARKSSFAYKGRNIDAKQVGHELGAGYLVEGSMCMAGTRVRLTAQLVDCASGLQLWAESFESRLDDIITLQNSMSTSIVGALIPRLSYAEFGRIERKLTESLDAYDCYIRGFTRYYEDTKEGVSAAQALFYKAIELDPQYALAYASAALCFEARKRNGWLADRLSEVNEAERLARRAVELAKYDAHAHGLSGFVLAVVVGDLNDGAALIDRARALNPNLARAWQFSAWVQISLGEPDRAIEHATRAMQFSPVDRWICSMQASAGFGHFFKGHHHEAACWAATALRSRPNYQPALRLSAASNALSGNIPQAQRAMQRLQGLTSSLRLSNLLDSSQPFRRSEDLAKYAEGLRRAGL